MRILLINDYGTASGGAERQMLALRADLRGRGHEVRMLTSDALLVPGWPIEADVTCHGAVGMSQPYRQTWNSDARRVLAEEIRAFRPDLTHIRMFLWQLSPAILPLLAGIPTLYQAAVYKAVCPNGLKLLPDGSECTVAAGVACLRNRCLPPPSWGAAMVQLALVRRYRRHIDRVVALSRDMADTLAANGMPGAEVVHNGIDERPMRPSLGETPIAAYAGRLSREKGVGHLIAAFARIAGSIPAARLLILGSGPEEHALRAQARAAGLDGRVEFRGYLRRDDMERALDGCWVQVVPSLWREPFGNVATEAMMRGNAVIATASGGLAEIVADGETGFLLPGGDTRALAAALGRILSDRALAERLGHAGRARALARFSRARVTDRFETIYAEMAERQEDRNR